MESAKLNEMNDLDNLSITLNLYDESNPLNATILITGDREQTSLPITLNAKVTHTDRNSSTININDCKYILNKNSNYLGEDESKYTGGTFSENEENIPLNIDSEGDWYFHVLTKNGENILKETKIGPISVNAEYHTHIGSPENNGGCYTTTVYHNHENCNSTTTWYVVWECQSCQNTKTKTSNSNPGIEVGYQARSESTCQGCGRGYGNWTAKVIEITSETNWNCDKTTSTIEGYDLSCEKTTNSIEKYIITY